MFYYGFFTIMCWLFYVLTFFSRKVLSGRIRSTLIQDVAMATRPPTESVDQQIQQIQVTALLCSHDSTFISAAFPAHAWTLIHPRVCAWAFLRRPPRVRDQNHKNAVWLLIQSWAARVLQLVRNPSPSPRAESSADLRDADLPRGALGEAGMMVTSCHESVEERARSAASCASREALQREIRADSL